MNFFGKYIYSSLNKKAIGPVIAIAMLLIVSVGSVVVFQNWFQTYQSDMFSKIESVNINSMDLFYIDSDKLYLRNYNSQNISYSNIKINDKSCLINGTILANTLSVVSLNNCTLGMNIGPKNIAIITDIGVYSKTLMLKSVTFTSTPTTSTTGNFSGYAWGEQFGYISFNGTNYQVKMLNNQLYGYAYSENLGYISFNGTNYNVTNINGVLVGFAYGENIGYIKFNSSLYQTTFNTTNLAGHAYSENYGFIHFSYNNIYDVIYN